jgi:Peptidase S46
MRHLATLIAFVSIVSVARADEGMWTVHDFPSAKVQSKYGFSPGAAWLKHAQLSSARLAGICSASFVSDSGLVMTNHHCAHDCVAGLSSADHDYVKQGFLAKAQTDEQKCPDLEVQRLDDTTDVTDKVLAATQGKAGAAYTAALREVSSAIEKPCETAPDIRCELVNLYHGGQFMLYRYKRYTDVRVVFAPELAIAFFGGDPDNFEFPRYDLDVSFVRVYENGQPAKTPEHFGWSASGPVENELTFTAGDPAATEREITMAQRVFDRDVVAPLIVSLRAEWRGQLSQYMRTSDEARRTATEWLFYNENSLKAWKGRQAALGDEAMMKKQRDAEDALRAQVGASIGSSYDAIATALAKFKPFFHRYYVLERWSKGDLLNDAIQIVRGGDERMIPDGKRLDEYRDSALPDVVQKLGSVAPVYPARDKLAIAYWLGKLREELGADDPLVRSLLGKASPEEVATRLVDGSKLGDPNERMRLWKGGKAAVAASKDPMIDFVRRFDADARKIRKVYDDEVDGVEKSAGEKIAKAKFAVLGRSTYPDATFTLRLSYGSVKGYTSSAHGTKVTPFTNFGGAFSRATGAPPFDLPPTWIAAQRAVDSRTTLDFVTTNDIIGGNSGSPIFDKNLDIVGLIFDGNIESLAGDFWYDETANRSVGVTSAALLEALSKIYHADRVAAELRASKHP